MLLKNLFLQFSFFILLSQSSFANDNETLLRALCARQGGEIVEGWICPQSGKQRSGLYCRVMNQSGATQTYNGCTGTMAGIGNQFFPACVLHDLCYHNEPRVHGRSKEDCDRIFYENMWTICQKTTNSYSCFSLAWTFFKTVANFGDSSWSCSKNAVPYVDSLDELL